MITIPRRLPSPRRCHPADWWLDGQPPARRRRPEQARSRRRLSSREPAFLFNRRVSLARDTLARRLRSTGSWSRRCPITALPYHGSRRCPRSLAHARRHWTLFGSYSVAVTERRRYRATPRGNGLGTPPPSTAPARMSAATEAAASPLPLQPEERLSASTFDRLWRPLPSPADPPPAAAG